VIADESDDNEAKLTCVKRSESESQEAGEMNQSCTCACLLVE